MLVKMIKIEGAGCSYAYSFQFSLITEDNIVSHGPSSCKEYILDAFWESMVRNANPLFKGNYKQVATDKVRMLIGFGRDDKWISTYVSFLSRFERECNITPSVVTMSTPSIWVVEGAADWVIHPAALSLYALIPRFIYERARQSTYEEILDKIYGLGRYGEPALSLGKFMVYLTKQGFKIFGDDQKTNWLNGVTSRDQVHGLGICNFVQSNAKVD